MTDLTFISVTSTAENALKKLKNGKVGVYRCKKRGAKFIFAVKDGQLKKVFAIFSNPCYNVAIEEQSRKKALRSGILNRIGLVIGAALFTAAALISNMFVLKISVSGSGSYLESEIKRIVYASGAREGRLYSGFDLPLATGGILALPQVTFCNIEKRGAILAVDVEVSAEHLGSVQRGALVADRAGTVDKLTVICGTAATAEGAQVEKGAELISPYTLIGEQRAESFAVGYCVISYALSYEYAAATESEGSLSEAYALADMTGDEVSSRTYSALKADGGVIYKIDCTLLHTIRINM